MALNFDGFKLEQAHCLSPTFAYCSHFTFQIKFIMDREPNNQMELLQEESRMKTLQIQELEAKVETLELELT